MIRRIPVTLHVHEDIYAKIDTGMATFEIEAHIHGKADGHSIMALNRAVIEAFSHLGSLTGNNYRPGQNGYRPPC